MNAIILSKGDIMFKKYIVILGLCVTLKGSEKNINLRDSSFEQLHTGYVGVYNPEAKTVLCTKITCAHNGPEEIEFVGVKAKNCLEVCKGKMIGTYKNVNYNPCQEADEKCEPPFFVLSIDL